MRKLMLLIDMPRHYSVLLEAEAGANDLETVRVDGEFAMHVDRQSLALAVVHLEEGSRRPNERVRTVRKLLPETRCVVIAEAIDSALAFDLGQLGIDALIALPTSDRELCDGCMAVMPPEFARASGLRSERSQAMLELRRSIRSASNSDSTVLLTGETGTGKSTLAREIHGLSGRSSGPFVHVNCAVLAPALIESELFGHERGAFTGAMVSRTGRIEAAGVGTLFLDEIGELELYLQAKLLRVLEEREFERVGGTRTIRMTARVIAATNRDLPEAVRRGEFRGDLFFRLGAFHIPVPALRDRGDDLPDLIEEQVRNLSQKLGVRRPDVSSDFTQRLMEYSWPGNIRELINSLESILIRESPPVLVPRHFEQLPLIGKLSKQESWIGQGKAMRPRAVPDRFGIGAMEGGSELRELLEATGGNVSRAARRLRIPRSTLRYRIDQQRLEGVFRHD